MSTSHIHCQQFFFVFGAGQTADAAAIAAAVSAAAAAQAAAPAAAAQPVVQPTAASAQAAAPPATAQAAAQVAAQPVAQPVAAQPAASNVVRPARARAARPDPHQAHMRRARTPVRRPTTPAQPGPSAAPRGRPQRVRQVGYCFCGAHGILYDEYGQPACKRCKLQFYDADRYVRRDGAVCRPSCGNPNLCALHRLLNFEMIGMRRDLIRRRY